MRRYVQRAEQFIRSLSGRRLADFSRQNVDDGLGRLGQDSRLQPGQFRQVVDAIPNLYSIDHTEWAGTVDWAFWRDSARTLEAQHATTAREHAAEHLGTAEVTAFREELAVERIICAGTQNPALNALVFVYEKVLKRPLQQSDVSTTQIYTHVLNRGGFAVRSPLDTA